MKKKHEKVIKQPNIKKEAGPETCLGNFFQVLNEDTFNTMHQKEINSFLFKNKSENSHSKKKEKIIMSYEY